MKTFALLCCIFFSGNAFAQDETFASIDNRARAIPSKLTFSADSIALYIQQNFISDRDRLRAIHVWTAANINYSTDSIFSLSLLTDTSFRIATILKRKKGVCEDFAAVFNAIANKCGIVSYVVNGYTKQGGRVDRAGHSWCAILLENTWQFCDPTWDKDARAAMRYFLISPVDMISTHMPFDPMWQLLEKPVTHNEFYSGCQQDKQAVWNIYDTVNAWRALPQLQQIQSIATRVQQAGLANEMVKNDVAVHRMNIEMIREDKDAELYNGALQDINEAAALVNDFIQYRNVQFLPAKPNAALTEMLSPAPAKLKAAGKKLEELSRSAATFQLDTEMPKAKVERLFQKLGEQEEFLKKYLQANDAQRSILFYNQLP